MNERESYKITRNDGTELEIWPQLDRLGNQIYEQVFNNRTNQMQCIPIFNIYAEELKDLVNSRILLVPILIDMDPNLLNKQGCLEYVANNMLNRERMSKVIHEYNGYAGILEANSYFQCNDPKIDRGIIESKVKTKKENDERMLYEREARERLEEEKIYENARNHQCSYDDSPEGLLSSVHMRIDNFSEKLLNDEG